MEKQLIGASLFSGGGLMDLAARRAGITVAFANEISEKFAAFHAVNFFHPNGTQVVDVRPMSEVSPQTILDLISEKYGATDLDFVWGGPPCVDYTRLNTRRLEGGDKSKKRFVLDFLDMCIALNPKIIVMEEVPELLSDKIYYPLFQAKCAKMNYRIKRKVMRAINYEGNSTRTRVIIIFIRKDLCKDAVFPQRLPKGIKMCGDFLDIDYYVSGHYEDRARYANEPMTTVTSGSPKTFFKNDVPRQPSVREIMLCMSVDPDEYILPNKFSYSTFRKVFGNGVPTMMAYHIFNTLVEQVLGYRKNEAGILVPIGEQH